MKVVIIGGGPAGMMAAITAAENKNEVFHNNLFNQNGYNIFGWQAGT